MNFLHKHTNLKLAVFSGLLTGLAYPPTGLGFFAWFSLVPLIIIWMRTKPSIAALFSFIAAVISNLISVYWIAFNSGTNLLVAGTSMIAAVFYLALWWMGAGFVFSKLRTKTRYNVIIIPFLWVLMEWLRSFGPLGFPWLNLALTQTFFMPLVQTADMFGTHGVGFWIVTVNTGFYLLTEPGKDKLRPVLFILGLLVSVSLFGISRIWMVENINEHDKISIAVTQPNINPVEKWEPDKREYVFTTMFNLLDSALTLKPDLVLWPESALPAHLRLSGKTRNQILGRLEAENGKLLTGTPDFERPENGEVQYFNGTIYIEPGKKAAIYRKIKLVPFGEYIPLSPIFPSLKKLNFGQANFVPGSDYTVFDIDNTKISNVICYESSFPAYIARFRQAGAEILTIQANDGWLGNSSGPYQHFELAKLRAVENRVSVVRAANTGISGYILPSGRVGYKAKLNEMDLFIAEVPIIRQNTVYANFPALFPIVSLLTIMCILIVSWFQKK